MVPDALIYQQRGRLEVDGGKLLSLPGTTVGWPAILAVNLTRPVFAMLSVCNVERLQRQLFEGTPPPLRHREAQG